MYTIFNLQNQKKVGAEILLNKSNVELLIVNMIKLCEIDFVSNNPNVNNSSDPTQKIIFSKGCWVSINSYFKKGVSNHQCSKYFCINKLANLDSAK